MNNEFIIDVATAELKLLDTPKLWMTARGLSRRIRLKYPELSGLSQIKLFDILSAHANSIERPRKIRNSPFPSLKTLEVLWGAIDGERVIEKEVEPPTMRAEGAEPNPDKMISRACNVLDDEVNEQFDLPPTLFLSYNFNDTEEARCIVDSLENRGHSVWMAGAQIVAEEIINDAVINAMKQAEGHLLYLSENALKSLWVGKETMFAAAINLPRTIIVNGLDVELMGLVRHWMSGGKSLEFGKIDEYKGVSFQAARMFQDLLKEYVRVESNVIYVFPDTPANTHSNDERVVSFSKYPDVIP